MIICKRPAHPDNHLQKAGSFRESLVKGRHIQVIIGKRKDEEEKKEKENENCCVRVDGWHWSLYKRSLRTWKDFTKKKEIHINIVYLNWRRERHSRITLSAKFDAQISRLLHHFHFLSAISPNFRLFIFRRTFQDRHYIDNFVLFRIKFDLSRGYNMIL